MSFMTDSKLIGLEHLRTPCFAILTRSTSELKLIDSEERSSSTVKISDHESRGIVTIDGEVFVVTQKEILKLHSDGRKIVVQQLGNDLGVFTKVILFGKKIYMIQPESMLCYDPVDNSLTDDLPGCGLGNGFCSSATDDTETMAMKYDPLTRTWEETAPMRKEQDAAAATLGGKIYVVGGAWHGFLVQFYNPDNNSWTEISGMIFGRYDFSACAVGDQLYAIGGDGGYPSYQHSIEVYDKNKWTLVARFQAKDYHIHSCFWPHVSYQSGTQENTDHQKCPHWEGQAPFSELEKEEHLNQT